MTPKTFGTLFAGMLIGAAAAFWHAAPRKAPPSMSAWPDLAGEFAL